MRGGGAVHQRRVVDAGVYSGEDGMAVDVGGGVWTRRLCMRLFGRCEGVVVLGQGGRGGVVGTGRLHLAVVAVRCRGVFVILDGGAGSGVARRRGEGRRLHAQ